MVHVDSIDDYQYTRMWLTTDGRFDQVFRVQAGSDAHIFLAENLGTSESDAYEIVIGGFTNARYNNIAKRSHCPLYLFLLVALAIFLCFLASVTLRLIAQK